MKIKMDEKIFIFPFSELNNQFILISNGYKKEIIECFSSYFVSKKKSKCIVTDDEGDIVKMEDINFIYLAEDAAISQNMELKTKTILNMEISEFIKNNPEDFQSINRITDDLKELLSDKGMIKLGRILNNGLNNGISFDYKLTEISSLLQMLRLNAKESCYIKLAIMNILLFENKNKPNIVYFDDEINDITVNWLDSLPNYVYVIIDSESAGHIAGRYDLLIMSCEDHLIKETETADVIKRLIYMNNPYIKSYLEFQNEKNIQLFNNFDDKTSTFMLKNDCLNSCLTL